MAANNWLMKQGMGTGFNIERTGSATPSFWQSAIASSTKQGCTHTRSFMPNTTSTTNFGIPGWHSGAWVPPASAIDPYLDCGAAVLAAGQKWHFDCWDVFNDVDQTNFSTVTATVTAIAQRIKVRGFDKTKFMVGAVNEWSGTSAAMQANIPKLRGQLSIILQDILGTDQIIVENAINWGNVTDSSSSSFTLTPGIVTPFIQCHDYDQNDEAGWQGVATKLTALEARLGAPAYLGEIGLSGQDGTENLDIWTGTLGLIGTAIPNHGKTIWAQTAGSAYRMNVSSSDGTLIGGIDWETANNNSVYPKCTLTAAQAATTSTATTVVTGTSSGTGSSGSSGSSGSTGGTATGTPVTAPVSPAASGLVISAATGTPGSARWSMTMAKATGGSATVKLDLDGKYQGTLIDNMPDTPSKTYQLVAVQGALAAGDHTCMVYIENGAGTPDTDSNTFDFTIAAAVVTPPVTTPVAVATPVTNSLVAELAASPAAVAALKSALGVA